MAAMKGKSVIQATLYINASNNVNYKKTMIYKEKKEEG